MLFVKKFGSQDFLRQLMIVKENTDLCAQIMPNQIKLD